MHSAKLLTFSKKSDNMNVAGCRLWSNEEILVVLRGWLGGLCCSSFMWSAQGGAGVYPPQLPDWVGTSSALIQTMRTFNTENLTYLKAIVESLASTLC
jgi:hypothetical protein